MRTNLGVVVGSALLWSWGFLAYLSPVLFPVGAPLDSSTGLELGFFASQVTAALLGVGLFAGRAFLARESIPAWVPPACALVATATSVALPIALEGSMLPAILACGVLDGVAVPLLGCAWGARYAVGTKSMRLLVVVSFLVAYLIYLVVSLLPAALARAAVGAAPLLSWLLWRREVLARRRGSAHAGRELLRESLEGDWAAAGLPWSALGIMLFVSLVGNLVASAILGFSYNEVDTLFRGGVFVCALISTAALVVLGANHYTFGVGDLYRLTISCAVVGYVLALALPNEGLLLGAALAFGTSFFLQVLAFVSITQATQERALSPLLSFGMGQGLVSAVVFLGNVAGKQLVAWFGGAPGVVDALCGIGIVICFLLLVGQLKEPFQRPGRQRAESIGEANPVPAPDSSRASEPPTTQDSFPVQSTSGQARGEASHEKAIEAFARRHGLTPREAEVASYLVRGRSIPYIADAIVVSTGTAKTHAGHIYQKVGVNSKQDLIDCYELFKGQGAGVH